MPVQLPPEYLQNPGVVQGQEAQWHHAARPDNQLSGVIHLYLAVPAKAGSMNIRSFNHGLPPTHPGPFFI